MRNPNTWLTTGVIALALLTSGAIPPVTIQAGAPLAAPCPAAESPPPLAGPDSPAGVPEPVEVEGVSLYRVATPAAVYYYAEGVAPATLAPITEGVDLLARQVPATLGLPAPNGPVAFYLFPSVEALREQTARLQGRAVVSHFAEGISYGATSRHPGIYFSVGEAANPAALLHLIAHEYVHQVVDQRTGGRPLGQWFNEGLAQSVARTTLRARYPTEMDELLSGWYVLLARGAARQSLYRLTELDGSGDWTRLGNGGADNANLMYAEAPLAYDRLVQLVGPAAVTASLTGVGAGQPWPEAFERATGLSLAEFQRRFFVVVPTLLPAITPPAGPATARFFAVAAGFTPGEYYTARLSPPDGGRPRTWSGTARPDGVVWVADSPGSAAPAGLWTLAVTGERSTRVSVSFRVGD